MPKQEGTRFHILYLKCPCWSIVEHLSPQCRSYIRSGSCCTVNNLTAEARKLEHERSPTQSPRKTEPQHTLSFDACWVPCFSRFWGWNIWCPYLLALSVTHFTSRGPQFLAANIYVYIHPHILVSCRSELRCQHPTVPYMHIHSIYVCTHI